MNGQPQKYDTIGRGYNQTRIPDRRITDMLVRLLQASPDSLLADIGAGTGNYSYELAEQGYRVIAVEPSEVMRRQGRQHDRLEWRSGVAEELPLEDQSVDGIICTLATHHFYDLPRSLREMRRAVRDHGRIVIFTADPRTCLDDCWIADYFHDIVMHSCITQPELHELKRLMEEQTKREVTITAFPLPHDVSDQFFFSGWRRPEAYLEESFRAGISSLSTAPKMVLEKNLRRLQLDLEEGRWHEKYGHILKRESYDCGYAFLTC